MNRIALGTVQFGLSYGIANRIGQVSRANAKSILQLAAANKVDVLDTAIGYGDSENSLGEIGVEGFKLVTKLPAMPNNCADVGSWVDQQLRESFSRLGVTSVYGLLLHRPEQLLGSNGVSLFNALKALKAKGLVEKIGISIYSPSELDVLTARYDFDLVQAPLSLIDQRLYSTGWLQRLKDKSVEVHTRSVFLQGLLLMEKADIPIQFMPWVDIWDKWDKWLKSHKVSSIAACLAFPLSFPQVDRVVIGVDSVSQLTQIFSIIESDPISDLPNLQCEDLDLINPSRW